MTLNTVALTNISLNTVKSAVLWAIALYGAALINPHRVLAEVPSPVMSQAQQVQKLLETGACYGCNLAGADLQNAHLIGADLRNANLEGANLTGANLEGADLMGANLRGTNLTQVLLSNADLRYTNMAGSNLERSIAYNADTRGAILTNINLANATIWNSGINMGGPEKDDEQPNR
jgi:uncharacterized protein YjbI with pentapeptide repeats